MSQERLSLADILSMYDNSEEAGQEDKEPAQAKPERSQVPESSPQPQNSLASIFLDETGSSPIQAEEPVHPEHTLSLEEILSEPEALESPWQTDPDPSLSLGEMALASEEPETSPSLHETAIVFAEQQERPAVAQEEPEVEEEPQHLRAEEPFVFEPAEERSSSLHETAFASGQLRTESEPSWFSEADASGEWEEPADLVQGSQEQEAQVILDVSKVDAGEIFEKVILDVSEVDAGDVFGQPTVQPQFAAQRQQPSRDVMVYGLEVKSLEEKMNFGRDQAMKTMTFGEQTMPETRVQKSGSEKTGYPAFSQVITTHQGEYHVNRPEEVQGLHQELRDIMTEVEQILARLHKSWEADGDLLSARLELDSAVKNANTSDIMRLGERIAQLGDVVKVETPSKIELSRLVMKLEGARAIFARYVDILWHC